MLETRVDSGKRSIADEIYPFVNPA